MQILRLLEVTALVAGLAWGASASVIIEDLEPPSTPGNAFIGTFRITPSEPIWAFGVGNDAIEDTAISGVSKIDGLDANDHWISALIDRASWDAGFNFDSIRPIGATPPSSFSIDTSGTDWLWGSTDNVAFYWLSGAGEDPDRPLAVLQPGTEYDAFKFFTSGPASPFATFNAPDGGDIATGETITSDGGTAVAEPSTLTTWSLLTGATLFGIRWQRRRRRAK